MKNTEKNGMPQSTSVVLPTSTAAARKDDNMNRAEERRREPGTGAIPKIAQQKKNIYIDYVRRRDIF